MNGRPLPSSSSSSTIAESSSSTEAGSSATEADSPSASSDEEVIPAWVLQASLDSAGLSSTAGERLARRDASRQRRAARKRQRLLETDVTAADADARLAQECADARLAARLQREEEEAASRASEPPFVDAARPASQPRPAPRRVAATISLSSSDSSDGEADASSSLRSRLAARAAPAGLSRQRRRQQRPTAAAAEAAEDAFTADASWSDAAPRAGRGGGGGRRAGSGAALLDSVPRELEAASELAEAA